MDGGGRGCTVFPPNVFQTSDTLHIPFHWHIVLLHECIFNSWVSTLHQGPSFASLPQVMRYLMPADDPPHCLLFRTTLGFHCHRSGSRRDSELKLKCRCCLEIVLEMSTYGGEVKEQDCAEEDDGQKHRADYEDENGPL